MVAEELLEIVEGFALGVGAPLAELVVQAGAELPGELCGIERFCGVNEEVGGWIGVARRDVNGARGVRRRAAGGNDARGSVRARAEATTRTGRSRTVHGRGRGSDPAPRRVVPGSGGRRRGSRDRGANDRSAATRRRERARGRDGHLLRQSRRGRLNRDARSPAKGGEPRAADGMHGTRRCGDSVRARRHLSVPSARGCKCPPPSHAKQKVFFARAGRNRAAKPRSNLRTDFLLWRVRRNREDSLV